MDHSRPTNSVALSELLRTRLVKADLIVLWTDLFGTLLEDDLPRCTLTEGVVALIDRAQRHHQLPLLQERLRKLRPDLRSELEAVFAASLSSTSPSALASPLPPTNKQLSTRFSRAFLLVALIAVAGILGWLFTQFKAAPPAIYHLRVVAVDETGKPVEDAKVKISIANEAKKVDAAWQFDIPSVSKPQDGWLEIFAAQDSNFLKGRATYQLGTDANPTVKVKLVKDNTSKVRGMVVDESNRAVVGATVSVVGYKETVQTSDTGEFILPAHAADGEFVRLHIEKPHYEAINQDHLAGDHPVTITLKRKPINTNSRYQ
jgi:hypothetical protein